jgi:hypothetical protein
MEGYFEQYSKIRIYISLHLLFAIPTSLFLLSCIFAGQCHKLIHGLIVFSILCKQFMYMVLISMQKVSRQISMQKYQLSPRGCYPWVFLSYVGHGYTYE